MPTARRKTSDVFVAIEETLRPYVGASMASTAAAAQAQRLGIDGPHIDEQQVSMLLGKLGLGLMVLLGEVRTKAVVAAMRQSIDGLEASP